MLSFEKMTEKDVELAWGYSDSEYKKKIFTVFYTTRDGKSVIVSDDIEKLLRGEVLRILTEFNITPAEYKLLCLHHQHGKPVDVAWPRGLKKAYLEIQKSTDSKLKRELEFTRREDVFMVPAFNANEQRTNYITTFWGSSGSGKSFAMQSLLLRMPVLDDVPMIYLFGSVGDEDPSFNLLKDRMRERFKFMKPSEMKAEDFNYRNYEIGAVLIFDDINSIANRRTRASMLAFLDTVLEVARHRSQIVFASNHLFHAYAATAKLRNSSRYLALFPRNTPKVLATILDREYGFSRQKRLELVKKCKRDSRMTFLSKNHPAFMMTEKRLLLL